jgi:phospholipase/carboxylesterase
METIEIGGLEAIRRPAEAQAKGTVIFFHGYGADMRDLAPLADLMDPDNVWDWYFPNGLLDVVIAQGYRGRAWYPINMNRLEELLRRGQTADLSGHRPDGLSEAVENCREFVEAVAPKDGKFVIGGFSQGAILSTELTCLLRHPPKGVVLMSGGLIDQTGWQTLLEKRSGTPYIQSHGTQDPILSYEGAKALNKLINKSGWRGDFVSFTGGHEIPTQVLQKILAFISRQLR